MAQNKDNQQTDPKKLVSKIILYEDGLLLSLDDKAGIVPQYSGVLFSGNKKFIDRINKFVKKLPKSVQCFGCKGYGYDLEPMHPEELKVVMGVK